MSDNVLIFYESLRLINTVARFQISPRKLCDLEAEFKNTLAEILRDCIKLKTLHLNKGSYKLSKNGIRIVALSSQNDQLREFVKLYLTRFYPSIKALLCSGKNKASIFLPDHIKQILNEAKILDSPHDYYEFSKVFFQKKNSYDDTKLKEIGTYGEKLSLKYEKKRVREKPNWIAIEDDGAGFDIESRIDIFNKNPLFIEVKTTTRSVENGNIHISRNEWETAKTKWGNYVFHIWVTQISKETPFILKPNQIKKHIPKERGLGKWSNVEIQTNKLLKNYNLTL